MLTSTSSFSPIWILFSVVVVVVIAFVAVLALVSNSGTGANTVQVAGSTYPNAIVTVVGNTPLVSTAGIYTMSPGLQFINGIPFSTIISLTNIPNQTQQFGYETSVLSTIAPVNENGYGILLEKNGLPYPEQDDLFVVVNAEYIFFLADSNGVLMFPNYYMNTTSSWVGSTGFDSSSPSGTVLINVYSGTTSNPVLLGSTTVNVVVGPYGEYTPPIRAAIAPQAPPVTAFPVVRLVDGLKNISQWASTFTFLELKLNNVINIATSTVLEFSNISSENVEINQIPASDSYLQNMESTQPSGVDVIVSVVPEVSTINPILVTGLQDTSPNGSVITTTTVSIPQNALQFNIEYNISGISTPPSPADLENVTITYDIDVNELINDAFPGQADPYLIYSTSFIAVNPNSGTLYSATDSSGNNPFSGPELTFTYGIIRDDTRGSRFLRSLFSARGPTSKLRITLTNLTAVKLKELVEGTSSPSPTGNILMIPEPVTVDRGGARDTDTFIQINITNNTDICGS